MDRRKFVYGADSAAFASLHSGIARLNVAGSNVAVKLTPPGSQWPQMPADLIGLSYEKGQLCNPQFFSRDNLPLVESFRGLNAGGVLRLGGHLSNITPWEGVGRNDLTQVCGVRHGIEAWAMHQHAANDH
jgi:hypothetical protein